MTFWDSRVTVRRPPGVAARLCLEGGAAGLAFDDQMFGAVCNEVRLQSPGYDEALGRYDVELSGGTSKLALTTAPADEEPVHRGTLRAAVATLVRAIEVRRDEADERGH